MADVNFYRGSREKYDALATKDANTLYFLDNGEIYLGETQMGGSASSEDGATAIKDLTSRTDLDLNNWTEGTGKFIIDSNMAKNFVSGNLLKDYYSVNSFPAIFEITKENSLVGKFVSQNSYKERLTFFDSERNKYISLNRVTFDGYDDTEGKIIYSNINEDTNKEQGENTLSGWNIENPYMAQILTTNSITLLFEDNLEPGVYKMNRDNTEFEGFASYVQYIARNINTPIPDWTGANDMDFYGTCELWSLTDSGEIDEEMKTVPCSEVIEDFTIVVFRDHASRLDSKTMALLFIIDKVGFTHRYYFNGDILKFTYDMPYMPKGLVDIVKESKEKIDNAVSKEMLLTGYDSSFVPSMDWKNNGDDTITVIIDLDEDTLKYKLGIWNENINASGTFTEVVSYGRSLSNPSTGKTQNIEFTKEVTNDGIIYIPIKDADFVAGESRYSQAFLSITIPVASGKADEVITDLEEGNARFFFASGGLDDLNKRIDALGAAGSGSSSVSSVGGSSKPQVLKNNVISNDIAPGIYTMDYDFTRDNTAFVGFPNLDHVPIADKDVVTLYPTGESINGNGAYSWGDECNGFILEVTGASVTQSEDQGAVYKLSARLANWDYLVHFIKVGRYGSWTVDMVGVEKPIEGSRAYLTANYFWEREHHGETVEGTLEPQYIKKVLQQTDEAYEMSESETADMYDLNTYIVNGYYYNVMLTSNSEAGTWTNMPENVDALLKADGEVPFLLKVHNYVDEYDTLIMVTQTLYCIDNGTSYTRFRVIFGSGRKQTIKWTKWAQVHNGFAE